MRPLIPTGPRRTVPAHLRQRAIEQPDPLLGLTTEAAQRLLRKYGSNSTPVEHPSLVQGLIRKLWAPVPWMLEASVVLELWLGKAAEAATVAGLLAFNVIVSEVQEGRAHAALDLLRSRLTVLARVRRDGRWQEIRSAEVVPGDVIHLRVGDVVPADARLAEGDLLADQSALTGESLPVELRPGETALAGTVIDRGEATCLVLATGTRTRYGRTAELVRTARTASHLEGVITRIVRALVALDMILAAAVVGYDLASGGAQPELLSFAVVLLLASVPVALPATFALASALGSVELARRGVLTARLSAIEEAASMDVLCIDKTGTITANQLTVTALRSYPPYGDADLLQLASLASDEATQDPIDLAILRRAAQSATPAPGDKRTRFVPFDPASKRSEVDALVGGRTLHVTKGAPQVLADFYPAGIPASFDRDVEGMASQGLRVLAVASGSAESSEVVGLVGLEDPPRPDSQALLGSIAGLGIRVVMITGDSLATARAVAAQVGLVGAVCSTEQLDQPGATSECGVFGGMFPDDKLRLVKALQAEGHVLAMTGDGVNDAPALKQAEVGVAVANATDVAKAAASLVLTGPGLGDLLAAVQVSRRIYQRMLTYALNASVRKLEIPVFLSVVLLASGRFALSPLLMVLLLVANDFSAMAIATDRVSFSRRPNRWSVRQLLLGAGAVAFPFLLLTLALYWIGLDRLGLDQSRLQSLTFVTLVLSSQAAIYLVREPNRLWTSRPGRMLVAVSAIDILAVELLAANGWLVAPLGPVLPAVLLLVIAGAAVLIDWLKVPVFHKLRLHET